MTGSGAFSKAASAFKVCPLCDELNRAGASECSVCGWRGAFLRDEESLRAGLRRLGGLGTLRKPLVVRALRWLRSRFRRRFDCTV